jgi:hypothetical protein
VRFRIDTNVMRLYNGRRSFYGVITVGPWSFWLMRWDTALAPANRFRSGDMGWTWGRRDDRVPYRFGGGQ